MAFDELPSTKAIEPTVPSEYKVQGYARLHREVSLAALSSTWQYSKYLTKFQTGTSIGAGK